MRICQAYSKARDGSVQREIQSGKKRYKGIARQTQEGSREGSLAVWKKQYRSTSGAWKRAQR